MQKLFDEDDQEDEVDIKTNTEYATNYNTWRRKEELNRLKTKYGNVRLLHSDSSGDSSSSEDDEDGRELTEEFEKDFFKTLSYLKNKNPCIYDENVKFFKTDIDDVRQEIVQKKDKKQDPLFLKDYEKKMIAQTGGQFEEDTNDEEEDNFSSGSPTYVEEQRRIKESLKQALSDDGENDENWGGLFKKRNKTKEEQEKDEEEFTKWLKGQKDKLNDVNVELELKPLKEYWNNPKLDKNESFLRDYLLNKKYLEKEDENYIPTYEEIIHDSDEDLSEDERAIEKQEEFEQKYNYRFEEPDQEFVKTYPRTVDHSVRKTDDKRKQKRSEIKQRKEEEKKQKMEELKQLKAYKRKEIEEKIMKLQEITGNKDLIFEHMDLEGDFDPEEYDKRMQELFSDEYYGETESEQKPEYPNFEEELGPWKDNNNPYCEDENFIMDCDYDPFANKPEEAQGKKKRKRFDKKEKKNSEMIIDENDGRYKKYIDELNKFDCEDIIGDLPCKFKYREVVPNSFGLTVEEILLAKDKELNRWCSLKKTTQHRPEHIEKYDVIAYQKKSKNEDLKMKVLSSVYEELDKLNEEEEKKKLKTEFNTVEDDAIEKDSMELKIKNKKKVEKEEDSGQMNEVLLNMESQIENKTGEKSVNSENKVKKKKKINTNIIELQNKKNIVENKANSEKAHIKKKKRKNLDKDATDASTGDKAQPRNADCKKDNEITNIKLSRRQRKNKRKLLSKSEIEKQEDHAENRKESKKRKIACENISHAAPAKKHKTNKEIKNANKGEINISNSRLEAYGINPKKYKNKIKFGQKK